MLKSPALTLSQIAVTIGVLGHSSISAAADFAINIVSTADCNTATGLLTSCQPAATQYSTGASQLAGIPVQTTWEREEIGNCQTRFPLLLNIVSTSGAVYPLNMSTTSSGSVSVAGGAALSSFHIVATGAWSNFDYFAPSCSIILRVHADVPDPVSISQALAAQQKLAQGWVAALTTASTNHNAFVHAQDGAYCTLISDFNNLSDMFAASGDLNEILQSGGEQARDILAEATQAAADNGAFDLAQGDAFTYFQNNQAAILSHGPNCSAIPAASLIPNYAACHGVGVCKSNVDAYNSAATALRGVVTYAQQLKAASVNPGDAKWVDVDAGLLPPQS